MRLSLPTHIPVRRLFPVLGAMLAFQVVEGTKLITALEFGAFLLVCADAFNALGGLIYPSGSYIFFFAVLDVGVGGVLKTFLGESLDSNVTNAERSMLAYLVGACSMWVAAKLAVKLRARRPWLAKLQLDSRTPQTAVGAALVGQYGGMAVPYSVVSTFNQVNLFLPLSVLILAYARTKETDGKRSFSILAFLIWAYSTLAWGVFAFSKQGMFLPSAVWAIGALVAGYRTSIKKLLLVVTGAIFAVSVLTPVSQIGRVYRNDPNSHEVAWNLLTHPLETRRQYKEMQSGESRRGRSIHWFNQVDGLLDRLTMFPFDDALMNVTDHGHQAGYAPIVARFYNVIPRYLLSGEKVTLHIGNTFGHEIGLLGKRDDTTGISFSPIGDVYHCLRWWGLILMCPLLLIMFAFCDSLTGSTEQTIWAALYVMLFTHAAPEGMIGTPFSAVSTYAFGVVLAALLSRYVLPYVGGFVWSSRPVQQATHGVQPWQTGPPAGRPYMARTIDNKI